MYGPVICQVYVCLAYGPTRDRLSRYIAFVKNPTEQLDICFQTWERLDPRDRKETRTTWAMTVGRVLKGESLARPKGPLEETIHTSLRWVGGLRRPITG